MTAAAYTDNAAIMAKAEAFYDNFVSRLLYDYRIGNPRVLQALDFVIHHIPTTARRVLDIGCGIGWSSHEMKLQYPDLEIVGVDLSSQLIQMADDLFSEPGVRFGVENFLNHTDAQEKFDVLVLIDVYEHFPENARKDVHAAFKSLLTPNGVILLTTPTPEHQNYLRQHKPEGLQPVDEDITQEVVEQLARDIDGRVGYHQKKKIWADNDYQHTMISAGEKKPEFRKPSRPIESYDERVKTIRARLGRFTLTGEVAISKTGEPHICIAMPHLPTVSETFVAAHLNRLPGSLSVLHGADMTLTESNDCLLGTKKNKAIKRLRRFQRKMLRPFWRKARVNCIANYLKSESCQVMLTEFGPTVGGVLEPCRQAGVPLVMHFHGYDAYNKNIIAENAGTYRDAFAYASAIIGVSRHMCQQLISIGAPTEKVRYLCYGVNSNQFRQVDPSKTPPVFFAVGRFVTKKAPDLTIQAFSKVLRQVPDAKLIMVGEGVPGQMEIFECCKVLINELGIQQNVELVGWKRHSEVQELMQQARVFVQHSITADSGDMEGTPVAVIEAQMSGLPVVATKHAGIPDVVVHEQTGYLVEERDVDAMAAYMTKLAQDPQLAANLGRAARERALQEFEQSTQIAKLAAILKGAIRK